MPKSIQLAKRSTIPVPDIFSYKLTVDAVNAEDMPDKIFVKQRIRNFARGVFEDDFVAVCTPVQLEDFPEDSPEEGGSSYYRTNSIELVMRTPEELQNVFDSLLWEVKKLVSDLSDIELLKEEEIFSIVSGYPVTTIPNAPQVTSILPLDSELWVYFNPPTSDGGTPIINYQYSLDNGESWISRIPTNASSPLKIRNLENNTNYRVSIRAVNNNGVGNRSASIYASPTIINVPSSPIINTLYSSGDNLIIDFSRPLSFGGSTIQTYQYSLDAGSTWQNAASNPQNLYQIIVENIAANVLYLVTIRAVTTTGSYGYKSNPIEYIRVNYGIGSIFTGSEDSSWTNLDNWLTSTREPAEFLPGAGTSVTLEESCVVNVDAQAWVEPAAISIGAHNLTFNSTEQPNPIVVCNITGTTGTVTFNGVNYGAPSVRVGSIFKGTTDTDWYKISNWLNSNRLPATTLPTSTTQVSLEHNCIVNVDDTDWAQPLSINITSYNITFNSTAVIRPAITCNITATTGTAIFNGVDYGV
jgi:hypothetical protein